MSEPIFIKNLKGLERFIAGNCDKDSNGKLENDEITIFNSQLQKYSASTSSIFTESHVEQNDATRVQKKTILENFNPVKNLNLKMFTKTYGTKEIIKSEAERRGVSLNDNDITYWAEKINSVAESYDIPKELLVSIIAQETNGKFTKNINANTGAGPMQITKITISDFFPGAKGNWNGIYTKMNSELLEDILYVKGKDGKKRLRYSSPDKLREACAKNDELGMKVGLLCFEMKYVKAVAKKLYGKATYANIPKVIDEIKSGKIKLSEYQNKACIKEALKNYNSVFKSYAPAVVDSLTRNGVNFKDLYFIK